jgi:sec-independent protein translocase protein TatA
MFGLGIQELVVIFLIVMVLFGAKKLPEIGKGLGKGIREFKRATELGGDDETDTESQTDTEPKKVESKQQD